MAVAVFLLLALVVAPSTCASLPLPLRDSPARPHPRPRAAPAQLERLPLEVTPSHYDLTLRPYFAAEGDFEQFDVDGTVVINGTVTTESGFTNGITFHADTSTLTIAEDAVTVTLEDPTAGPVQVPVTMLMTGAMDGSLMIMLQEDVSGTVTITIPFRGRLTNDMDGFYVSTYQNGDQTVYLASTQFEATSARRAFPCFDEPALKATFTVTVVAPDGYGVVFNTDPAEVSTEAPLTPLTGQDVSPRAGLTTYTFETTRPMSTYLVALVVYDTATFGASERPATEDEGPQRVWSRSELASQRQVALDAGAAALAAYGRLFPDYFRNMNTKMDQAAIPDFSAGAMENWGLVTYRERALLIDEAESTTTSTRSAVTTIAHELSHQWFGDLVSPDFWNVLWLNEGFATYWSYFADLGNIVEGWGLDEQFLSDEVTTAMDADAAADTHPMTTPDNSEGQFDDITYSKGGAILRMFSHIIGVDEFYSRLNTYLNNRAYSSATPDDLFAALADGSDWLQDYMQRWTTTAGYPVINFTVDGTTATLSQERFLLAPSDDADTSATWPVLLTYTLGVDFDEDAVQHVWVGAEPVTIEVPEMPTIFANLNWTGFYRVNFDEMTWQMAQMELVDRHLDIPRATRAQILSDLFSLARAGYVSYELALDVSTYLQRETDFLPWAVALRALDFLNTVLAPTEHYASFQRYLRAMLQTTFTELTFGVRADDSHLTKVNRINVLKWACQAEMTECVDAATELIQGAFDAEDGSSSVQPDLRATTYCVGARDNATWAALWRHYLDTRVATEKVQVLAALGCSQDETVLTQYLTYALDSTLVRPQDLSTVYSAVYSTPLGLNVALDFIANNAEALMQQSSTSISGPSVGSIIGGLASYIATQDQLDKLQALAEVEALSSLQESIEAAVASATVQLSWIDAHVHEIGMWMDDQTYDVAGAQSRTAAPAVLVTAAALLVASLL